MLPPEILDEICTHLELSEVVKLGRALGHLILDTSFKKALFKECPFYDIRYSQWDDWRSSASNFLKFDTRVFHPTLECPVYIDTPLPGDFQCLCSDVDLNKHFVYNDKGVFLKGMFVYLRKSPDVIIPCYPPRARVSRSKTAVQYNDLRLHVPGTIVMKRCTPQIMTVVYRDAKGGLYLHTFKDGQEFGGKLLEVSFKLQVVGSNVMMAFSGPGITTFCVVNGEQRKSYFSDRFFCIVRPPAGMLFYDGHVFDVMLDTNKEVLVQSTKGLVPKPPEWTLNKFHKVEQDERNVEYALVYNGNGFVCAFVDLKQHKMMKLSEINETDVFTYRDGFAEFPTESHLKIVGISEGKVGVWKFSKKYLDDKFREQHTCDMPEEVDKMFHYAREERAKKKSMWSSARRFMRRAS